MSAVNILLNMAEVTYYRLFLNKGINLEQRLKMKTERRVKDLIRISVISFLVGIIFITLGFKFFEK